MLRVEALGPLIVEQPPVADFLHGVGACPWKLRSLIGGKSVAAGRSRLFPPYPIQDGIPPAAPQALEST